MAVGPRKNKVLTTQSTTILTFFTPGASSSKATITSVAQKKKRRTPSVNVLPNQHEIIVIDSDEDDSSGPMLRKKRKTESKRERRAVDNSSDIEFVEHKTVAPSAEPSESYVPFGKPTSLLLDSSSSPKVSETPSQTLSPAPFGKPTVLLRSSKDNISLENEAGTSIEETFPEVFDIDDWDTGDDEVAQIVLDDVPEDEVREVAPDQPTTAIPSAEVSKSRSTPAPKSQRPVSSFDVIKTSPTPSNPQCRSTNSDLYSVLLSSRKENEAWKEAAVAEDRGFRPSESNGGRRKAPFYKVLQGMPIAVDAFKYGTIPSVTAYFLT